MKYKSYLFYKFSMPAAGLAAGHGIFHCENQNNFQIYV